MKYNLLYLLGIVAVMAPNHRA